MPRRWTVLASRVLYERPPHRLRLDRCRTSTGHQVDDYLVREVNDAALVFALTGARDVVLVRQYRHGVGAESLELPQGLLEDGEGWAEGGARELLEETGYAASGLEHIAELYAHPALQSNRVHVLLATGAWLAASPSPEPDEDLEALLVPLADLEGIVARGEMRAASSVAAALLALRRLGMPPS